MKLNITLVLMPGMALFMGLAANRTVAQTILDRGQEVPTQGMLTVHAWCRDFFLGSRPWDGKTGSSGFYDLWGQLAGERGEFRIEPVRFGDGKTSNLNASCQPDTGLVSPDARWVALPQKYCTGYRVAYVLQRDEDRGFKPFPKLVSEMGWDLFYEMHPDFFKTRNHMDGITSPDGGSSICDLVAWEPDGSRVWFLLRGGARTGKGIRHWYFAWEPKTGKAVVPDEVQAINRFAEQRWLQGLSDVTFTADWDKAEEAHYCFLAAFTQRIEQPGITPDSSILRSTWREKQQNAEIIRRATQNGGKVTPASLANEVIYEQRQLLFRASLKAGTMATLSPSEE